MNKLDLLDERSEQVHEFMSDNPSWIIRQGVSYMSLILLVLLGISFIVKFPDKITASIVVTTRIPPATIIAQASGKLRLLVRDHQIVAAGKVLAVIDNATRWQDLQQVQDYLSSFQMDIDQPLAPLPPASVALGELQPYFTDFMLRYRAHRTFMELDPMAYELRFTRAQIQEREKLLRSQQLRQHLLSKELAIVQLDYARNQTLYRQKVVPISVLEGKERELLQAQGVLQGAQLAMEETSIQITNLRKESSNYRLQYEEKRQGQAQSVQEAYKELLGQIAAWEQRYLLRAPQNGKVAFFKYWSTNQYVKNGEDVLTIVPNGKQEVIGKLVMPAVNSAKVRLGQRVIIRLNDYQYSEFGMLTGNITNISAVPKGQRYAIEVSLPQRLTSSYHRDLQFRPEMQGTADIVTEDLRLIERIYYQFKPVFSQ